MDEIALYPSRRALLASGLAAGALTLAGRGNARSAPRPVFGKVERLDPALDALVDADAVVEDVMDGFAWSEGPVWVGGADGRLLVSDPRGNLIRQWSARTGASEWLKPSGYAGADGAKLREPGTNGLFQGRGGLVVADSGNRCIGHIDLKTRRKTVIADRFEGKRFNSPNDLCISPVDGAIYFSDPPWGLQGGLESPDRELDYTGVFRVAPDNSVSLVGKYDMPNGVGISPDGRTLYHTDGKIGWVAHRLDAGGRSVSERPFIDRAAQKFTGNSGDSLKVDQAGNVWLSGRDGLSIVDPAGRRIGIVRVHDVVSNCEIGADGHLYMTCNHKVARVRVKARKLKSRT
ncbi:SMP-30/gluconolactonase/LRE family protein [Sphingobium aquiterrae]|uniref:SMP-30/gluconolactonase/LRE family protein n=1 Tax=Sphingobium aquiterrae TaxID=2038656 RepID=UPI0030169F4B